MTLIRRPLWGSLSLAVVLALVATTLGVLAPSARADDRPPGVPSSSREIFFLMEKSEMKYEHFFINYMWYTTCSVDFMANIDPSEVDFDPETGLDVMLRTEWGNPPYEVVFDAQKPYKVHGYGVMFPDPVQSNIPPNDPQYRDACSPAKVEETFVNVEANVRLWTVGEKALDAAFTSALSETNQGEVAFTSTTVSDWPLTTVDHAWDFGDGETSTEINPVHTYAKPGTYQVRLDVSRTDEQDTVTKEVEVKAPDLRFDWMLDDVLVEDEPVELIPGEERELTLRVWTTWGLGDLTEVKPDLSRILDLPSSVEVIDEPEFPDEGVTLAPVAERKLTWRIKATDDGEGSISTPWTAKDANDEQVQATGTLAYSSPALVLDLTQEPDPFLIGVDTNDDGKVDEDDTVFRVRATLRNVISDPITDLVADGSGSSPVVVAAADGVIPPERHGEHRFELGDLGAGDTKVVDYEFTATQVFRADASLAVTGHRGDGEVTAQASTRLRAFAGELLDVELEPERTTLISGQPARFHGVLKNLSRIEVDGEVLDEGHPIGVVLYPRIDGNAGNGFVTEASYGGRTPTSPVEFMVQPGEEVEISGFAATQTLPAASTASIGYDIAAWLHDPEEDDPVRLGADRIESAGPDGPGGEARTPDYFFEIAGDPPATDPWLSCSETYLGFTAYVSCRLTVGIANMVTGLAGLVKMVGTGLWTIGDATVRSMTHTYWMLGRLIEAVQGDQAAMDALVTDVVISLQALQQVGAESLRGITIAKASIQPKIEEMLTQWATLLKSGNIKLIAGQIAQLVGENIDMPLEALIKARAAAKVLEAATDVASPASKALARQIDEQAATVATRVEDALNTGGVAKLTKGGVLKSGDRLTAVPAAWRAMGLSRADLDAVLKVAEELKVMLAFRARSARSTELLEAGLAWEKSGDIALKTVNDLDRIYLDYLPDWEGKVVLVQPPVDWTLTGQARTDAIEAYLDKFGQLTSPSDFSRDLRNQVRDRLELRLDEYPKGLQSYTKYLDEGIDGNFHIEKQGLPEHLMPNNEPPWQAKVELDSIPAGASGNPERRVFHLEMAPPGSNDFRPITGDVDFLGFFNLDGSLVENESVRTRIYEALRGAIGMQHGESISFSPSVTKREQWLSAHKAGGEAMMVANADGHLYAAYLRDDLSALDWNPNRQYMAEEGRPFVFVDGMITEASSEIVLPTKPWTGPTWTDRMAEVHAAYKKYDPKKILETAQEADKNKDKEAFDKAWGRLFRVNLKGDLSEYKPGSTSATSGTSGRSRGRLGPAAIGPQTRLAPARTALRTSTALLDSQDVVSELAAELARASDAGMTLPDTGRLGGTWVPVSRSEALDADGHLRLTPMSYLSADVTAGGRTLPVFGPSELRMGEDTPFFAIGDEIVIDPGGPHEQTAKIAGLAPLRVDRDIDGTLPAQTAVAMLTPVMKGQTPTPGDPDRLTMLAAPSVVGAAIVGETLRATAGTWKPAPSRSTYQWLRNGAVIPGAVAGTYRVRAADRGARLAVRVTATRPGHTTGVGTSPQTAPVKARAVVKVGRKVRGKKIVFNVRVTAAGVKAKQVTGKITIKVRSGKRVRVKVIKLVKGKATVKIDRLRKGRATWTVSYAGSTVVSQGTASGTVRIRR